MRISTKGRYALRILIDLAQNGEESNVSVRQISERQGISEKYLEGIIAKLHQAKLVRSVRGKYGGYRLVRPASDYSVYEILCATEDTMSLVSCLDGNDCGREDSCTTIAFWTQLQDRLHGYLKSVTLQHIMDNSYEYL